jgi:hypothetical protein
VFCRFFCAVIVLLLSGRSISAALITNGDFEAGTLVGWTIFTTVNGTVGTGNPPFPRVIPFDTTGNGPSLAAQFEVGQLVSEGVSTHRGGGIFQTITTGAGLINLDADVASLGFCQPACVNGDGGQFDLLLDGMVLDSVTFGDIASGQVLRAGLTGLVPVAAGNHDVRILVTRAATESGVTQYIDNISASSVPEPGSAILLSLGAGMLLLLRIFLFIYHLSLSMENVSYTARSRRKDQLARRGNGNRMTGNSERTSNRFPMLSGISRGIIAMAFLLLVAPGAKADVMYCYQGNHFDTASGPYTAMMSVSGCLTLTVDLSTKGTSGLTSYASDAVAFSFTDGVQTLSFCAGCPRFAIEISFATVDGTISEWDVQYNTILGNSIRTSLLPGPIATDEGIFNVPGGTFTPPATYEGQNDGQPGIWTSHQINDAIPEPASSTLLMTAIAAVALLVGKKSWRSALTHYRHLVRNSEVLHLRIW